MQSTATPSRERRHQASRGFATTHWSLVVRAKSPDGQRALAELCRRYWAPVHAFIRGLGLTPEDAADVTQGLFESLLKRNDFATVDRTRGRFRSWLRACARNYVASWFEHHGGVTVGAKATHVSVDSCQDVLRDELTPDRSFDRQWALTVLSCALARLRCRYERANKVELFVHLHPGLGDSAEGLPDKDLAPLLGKSVGAIKVERHRLRRRFHECVRAEVAQTVADEGDVEEELRRLIDALA